MKRLSAIVLTLVLVAAFALALTACNPVEKTETFNVTKEDLQTICADTPSAYSHYQVTNVVSGATSSFELYLIDYSQLPESYGLSVGYSVYVHDVRADGSARYRIASGKNSNVPAYGEAALAADGSVLYSYAIDSGVLLTDFNGSYKEAYGLTSIPAATSIHGEYKSDIATPKSALTNALNNADCTVTAERHIKGKDVVEKVYTVDFDFNLKSNTGRNKGTVTVRTDAGDKVTEISVVWENGDSNTTKYVDDGTGEVGYTDIFSFDTDNLNVFFELCGVPEHDIAKGN